MEAKDKMQRILDKLRKLMDLKESAMQCGEVGEANAAAAGITRLLKEYDLTLQDIPSELKPADPVGIDRLEFTFPYMQYPWYWILCSVVARHNGAEVIRTRYFGINRVVTNTYYKVVGRAKNRYVTQYLISFLCHQFIYIGKRNYPEWKLRQIRSTGKTPPTAAVYMRNFLLGCVSGVDQKLDEEESTLPKDKVTALEKRDTAAIEAFLKDMDCKNKRQGNKKILDDVFEDGYQVGKSVNIHKGLAGTNRKTSMLEDTDGPK